MAYKEFRNEKLYEGAEIENQGIKQGLGAVSDAIVAKKAAAVKKDTEDKKLQAEKLKAFTQEKGYYPKDHEEIVNESKTVVSKLMAGQDVTMDQMTLKAKSEKSKMTLDKANALREVVDKADKYTNKTKLKQSITDVELDEKTDINNRYEKVTAIEKNIDAPENYLWADQITDHIASLKTNKISKGSSVENGAVTTGTDNSWETVFAIKDGKPVVTTQHTINYLNSDPRNGKVYQARVDQKLLPEALKDPKYKDLATGQEKVDAYVKDHPEIKYGEMVQDEAKAELQARATIHFQTDYTKTEDEAAKARITAEKEAEIRADEAPYVYQNRSQSKGPNGEKINKTIYAVAVGRNLSTGKESGFKTSININGGINMSPNRGTMAEKIDNNVPVDARVSTVGYTLLTKSGNIYGRGNKEFADENEAVEFMLSEINKLQPGEKAPFNLTLAAIGDFEGKTKVKNSGTSPGANATDTLGKNLYSAERQAFLVKADKKLVNEINQRSKGAINPMEPTPAMQRVLDAAEAKGVRIVNPYTTQPVVKKKAAPAPAKGNKNTHKSDDKKTAEAKKKQSEVIKKMTFSEYLAAFEKAALGGKRKATAKEIEQVKAKYEAYKK